MQKIRNIQNTHKRDRTNVLTWIANKTVQGAYLAGRCDGRSLTFNGKGATLLSPLLLLSRVSELKLSKQYLISNPHSFWKFFVVDWGCNGEVPAPYGLSNIEKQHSRILIRHMVGRIRRLTYVKLIQTTKKNIKQKQNVCEYKKRVHYETSF